VFLRKAPSLSLRRIFLSASGGFLIDCERRYAYEDYFSQGKKRVRASFKVHSRNGRDFVCGERHINESACEQNAASGQLDCA